VTNVVSRVGDGYQGWPTEAPFDRIIVTAAPDHVPQPLIEQLGPGGRLVIPVGGGDLQQILIVDKSKDGKTTRKAVLPVRFVPMTGEAQGR
jgi:protein-L-isoaspartate(D-aspartate) O-methyltransferase